MGWWCERVGWARSFRVKMMAFAAMVVVGVVDGYDDDIQILLSRLDGFLLLFAPFSVLFDAVTVCFIRSACCAGGKCNLVIAWMDGMGWGG